MTTSQLCWFLPDHSSQSQLFVDPLPLEPPVPPQSSRRSRSTGRPRVSTAARRAVRATRGRVHAAVLPSLFVPPSPRPSVSSSLLSASSSPFLPGKFYLVLDPPCRVGSSVRWFLSLRFLAPELWPAGLAAPRPLRSSQIWN